MKVLQIFRVDLAANTQTEYLTLYLAPIVFFLMIGEMNRDAATWKKQCIHGIVILMTTFAAVATILQATNMEHYPRLLSYFHIFGGVSLALVAVCSIGKEKKRDSVDKSMLVGILILGASVALDLVRFNIQKYMLQDERWLTISVIPIGALLFVVMLLISYIFYIYNMLVTRAEQEWLAERAYHDELCHTFNRTKCNEEFLKMDASARPYALINMDLNGLKTINDTYGHTQGDLLLQEFASILQAAFRGVGDVFRMGGDEFLVIVQEEQFDLIDDAVVRMENLEKRRSGELPFVIDASYGIAKSIECVPVKTEKVYTLADQRMYEMKVSKKRGNRLR
jgi:diguanylate cyclase (GGDEF)-like protein